MGPRQSSFWVDALGQGAPDVELDLGWNHVKPGPFAQSPPRPLELEKAIDYVEEQVMPLARIIPGDAVLAVFCVGEGAPRLAGAVGQDAAGAENVLLTLAGIEAAFARLAALAHGAPVGDGDEPLAASGAAAALLIVRELMHHAGLQRVVLG